MSRRDSSDQDWGGDDDDSWYVPAVFDSEAQYSELMLRWVEEDAKCEGKREQIRNVEVRIGANAIGSWRGHFRRIHASQPTFRPQQNVIVDRQFHAVVTAVDGSDVTVEFRENAKFDKWVARVAPNVKCEIMTEGKRMEAKITLDQEDSSKSDELYAFFTVSDKWLRDVKPGVGLKLTPRSPGSTWKKKDKDLIGTVLSLDIDNRVCVKLEPGSGDGLQTTGKFDVSFQEGMGVEHLKRALKSLPRLGESLFDVPVRIERVEIGGRGRSWYGTFKCQEAPIRRAMNGARLFLIESGKTEDGYLAEVTSSADQLDKSDIVEVKFCRNFSSGKGGVMEMDIYPEECVRHDQILTPQDARSLNPGMARQIITTTGEIKRLWLGKKPKKRYSTCTIGPTFGGPHNFYWRARPLSASQKEAVEVAMSQPLTIIQGPAGTGKTTCVAAYVWNTVKKNPDSKVLVTTPSRSSLDQAVEYLVRADLKVVRIQSRAEANGPEPSSPNVRYALLREKVKNLLKNVKRATEALAEGGFKLFKTKDTEFTDADTRSASWNQR